MKKAITLLAIICLVVGCSNNQTQTNKEFSVDEFQKYADKKNEDGMIAIETTFEPTLELTEELRKTSLEELIKQGKGKLSKVDQMILNEKKKKVINYLKRKGYSNKEIKTMEESGLIAIKIATLPKDPIEYSREYKLKYVPETSNLAKVYYLEDAGRFIEHNQKYYNDIISQIQESTPQDQEQKNWDKYL